MHKPNVVSAATPARLRRGRKPKSKVALDIILTETEPKYEAYRAYVSATRKEKHSAARSAGEMLSRTEAPPYEVAAETMQEARKEIGNISTKRLLNLMSEHRRENRSRTDWPTPDDYDPPDHIADPPSPVAPKISNPSDRA